LAYRLRLNDKVIWDNTDFENILVNNLYGQPRNYLPPKCLNDKVISVGGWKIDVQSTIHANATCDDVINGYNELEEKLNLNIKRLFLPFFVFDITNFDLDIDGQKLKAYEEPMIVMFLRLCYWYHKCNIRSGLGKKNKEIRDKLKISNTLIDLIKTHGFNNSYVREWLRQAIGIIYELICASLSDHYNRKISFEKRHDFILENTQAEVKTIFPPANAEYREDFYPFLNAHMTNPDADLKYIMKEFIKIPKIMDNNLKDAIECQQGRIIFLNIILENRSSALTFLSEYKLHNLTFKNSLDNAIKLLDDKSTVPLIISFHAVHCKYEVFALTIPIPIKKENNQTKIDITRM
jgi:hypothetical protein